MVHYEQNMSGIKQMKDILLVLQKCDKVLELYSWDELEEIPLECHKDLHILNNALGYVQTQL